MDQVKIDYLGGVGFKATAGQHSLVIDLPSQKGGGDAGMTPPEIFMVSLGSCIGVYVARYCQTAKLNAEGLSIALEWNFSDDKTRIASIDVVINLPQADIGKRKNALLEAAHHCLIHNTILNPPAINIELQP